MKKRIILLSIMLLLVSGCSTQRLSDTSFQDNISMILSKDTTLANVNFEGYKYYVPNGMRFVTKEDYNAIFRDRYNNQYYLYVDAIGYYHKTKNTYKVDKNAYYSKKLNYNKKNGYIEINKVDDQYFIEMVFNYSKMEVYVPSQYLVRAVDNICYILQSVQFNDKVLESLIGENVLNYKEESFNIFESKTDTDDSVLEFKDWQQADIDNNGDISDGDNFEIKDTD